MSLRGDEGYRGSSKSSYKSGEAYKQSDGRSRRDRSKSRERPRYRSRSRSKDRKEKGGRRSDHRSDTKVREMSISPLRGDRDRKRSFSKSPSPPPPPMISKVSIEFKNSGAKPLKMTINPQTSQSKPAVVKKPVNVASVFNDASDEEPEEMPPEARMRMRNIGRDTPTSAGPNSYGKTKHGFCDQKAITQKTLKVAMEQANPPPPGAKFAGTIYKLTPK